jgi:hypothetical protein
MISPLVFCGRSFALDETVVPENVKPTEILAKITFCGRSFLLLYLFLGIFSAVAEYFRWCYLILNRYSNIASQLPAN